MNCRLIRQNGHESIVKMEKAEQSYGFDRYILPAQDWETVKYADVGVGLVTAKAGDEGYLVFPQGHQNQDSFLTFFTERADAEYENIESFLNVYGVRQPCGSFCGIVEGLQGRSKLICSVRNGKYDCFVRFQVNGKQPYEAISVLHLALAFDHATYSDIGTLYRNYLLDSGRCKPLAERHTPALDYAKESLYIRIRQAWKPVPSPVPEQTDENEPPIHVAVTFDRVIDLMEECHRQGVEKAEFCLVGWNKSGHDGRYPQIFPVEPMLGGMEGLKKVIACAKRLGYTVSSHTNSSEAYSIADCYDENDLALNEDGQPQIDPRMWGGGKPRKVCPICALRFAEQELPKVRDCGFNGMHYIDVLSINTLIECYSPAHPCNPKQSAEHNQKMGMLCRELFGGFSSEGGRDHTMPAVDYALYISFNDPTKQPTNPMIDQLIPLWEIVYHGLALYNPYTCTVNPTIKPKREQMLAVEYGTRPTFYYYSRFKTDPKTNWMGLEDMQCGNEEELRSSVARLKESYEDYRHLSYLQNLFIVSHAYENGVSRTEYSDGSVMTTDFSADRQILQRRGVTVWEKSYGI